VAGNCAAEDALRDGAWALQFEINGDFDLTSFQGSTISIKKHTGDRTAYRLGLDLTFLDKSGNNDDLQTSALGGRITSENESQLDTDNSIQDLSLAVQRISYPHRGTTVKMFYGVGPSLGYLHKKSHRITESTGIYFPSSGTPDTTFGSQDQVSVTNGWAIGLEGVVGVEWFFNGSLSLLAEYNSSLEYQWSTTESTSSNRSRNGSAITKTGSSGKSDSDGIDFSAGAVKFGLSAYF